MRARPLIAGLVILLSTAHALAAPSPEAQRLFEEGRQAMTKSDFDTACTKFAESLRLEEAGGTLLNLGDCEEKRGHFAAAEGYYRRAEKTFTNPQKQQFASANAARVAPHVASYVVHAAAIPGLVIRDGAEEIAPDSVIRHDPGDVTLRAEAPGRKPKELKATLTAGAESSIEVGALEPEAIAPPPPPPPKPVVTRVSTLSTVGIVVGAVGVASLATGAVTGFMALGRASTVEDHCDDALACDREGVDAASSGSTLSTISTITVAAGAALAIGGGVLFFVGRRSSPASGSPATKERATILVPSASPAFAGVFLGHRF